MLDIFKISVIILFASQNAPLAQSVEQLTLNQWVLGSNPRRCTMKKARDTAVLRAFCFFDFQLDRTIYEGYVPKTCRRDSI